MFSVRWQIVGLLVLVASPLLADETSKSVEVRTGKIATAGTLLAQGKHKAMLLDRTGRLHDVDLSASTMKPLSGHFQPLSVTEIRNQLSREFGNDFEVGTTRHYLVVASRGRANGYAAIFEEQYATMLRYFRTRGFTLSEPRFPLVAVVFPDRTQFVRYSQGDGAKAMSGMAGYYSPKSNRVALFESSGRSVAASGLPGTPFRDLRNSTTQPGDSLPMSARWDAITKNSQKRLVLPETSAHGSIGGDLKATMIHEATHQIAYNIGLHSRLGETPRWVVEGMATVFEPDGMRDSSAGWTAKQRINRERYVGFQNFAQSRRPPKSLRTFIESDSLYDSAVADFYAQSWALSFFLIETRPRNYSAYLKRIAARDPFSEYRAADRQADFKAAFQADFDWLDAQFLRYFDGLK